jgi:hypothetical protein
MMSKGEEYSEFVEKFKPKKTTDDCYTPENIYEVAKEWAIKELGWEGREVVRPFYPGGDYEHYNYPAKCVVIDNPPFSIIAKIVRFYEQRGIDYFLFAPQLTCLGLSAASHICAGVTVTYDNGARVCTSFVASKGPLICSAPDLYAALNAANDDNLRSTKNTISKYTYPENVLTSSSVALMSKYGIKYATDTGIFARALDEQRAEKKAIFGAGYIVPREAVRKAQEAVRKAQKANSVQWQLSERELAALSELETSRK